MAKNRVILTIQGDNITALHMVDRLKGTTTVINKISREIALEYGDSTHRPSKRAHIPGIANNVADSLSRRTQPNKAFVLPNVLRHIIETETPVRDSRYYIAKIDK